mgnify:CR=1 FL=1
MLKCALTEFHLHYQKMPSLPPHQDCKDPCRNMADTAPLDSPGRDPHADGDGYGYHDDEEYEEDGEEQDEYPESEDSYVEPEETLDDKLPVRPPDGP